ncbi:hypothetical protein SDJN02_25505, partial [Cucurbita argyrosperma subsp. argyrosperma]
MILISSCSKTRMFVVLKMMEVSLVLDSGVKFCSSPLITRILKLHSWEHTFCKEVLQLRKFKRSWLKRYLYR